MRHQPRLRHRLLVYFGLQEDPELEARWEREDVDRRTRLTAWTLPGLLLSVAVIGGGVVAMEHSHVVRVVVAIGAVFSAMGTLSELASRRRNGRGR